MTRRSLLLAAFLTPALALAQSGDVDMQVGGMAGMPPMPGMRIQVRTDGEASGQATTQARAHAEQTGDGFRAVWDTDPEGGTWFKVLSPEGFRVAVRDDRGFIQAQGTVPVSFRADGQRFYEVELRTPNATFKKKFEAKSGMVAQVWIAAPPAAVNANVSVAMNVAPMPAPQPAAAVAPAPASPCGSEQDFGAISQAISAEDFSDGKLRVLEDAAGDRGFCVEHTVRLLKLFDFEGDKLKALQIVAPRLTDRANKFKIYEAFEFSGSRDEAKKILR